MNREFEVHIDLEGKKIESTRPPAHAPQHFLNFSPLPQGQGSLRPVLGSDRWAGWGGSNAGGRSGSSSSAGGAQGGGTATVLAINR